ncbi:hypothetical protein GCM10027073_38670 [Streptomyces chlorus]
MVAHGQVLDAGADLLDHARTLVPTDGGERGVSVAGPDMIVGVTHAGGLDPYEDLVLLGRVELDLLDAPRPAGLPA